MAWRRTPRSSHSIDFWLDRRGVLMGHATSVSYLFLVFIQYITMCKKNYSFKLKNHKNNNHLFHQTMWSTKLFITILISIHTKVKGFQINLYWVSIIQFFSGNISIIHLPEIFSFRQSKFRQTLFLQNNWRKYTL